MKSKQQIRKSMIIGAVVVIVTALTFSRLTGIENIRAVHVLTLLACGMGIGVFLTNMFAFFKKEE